MLVRTHEALPGDRYATTADLAVYAALTQVGATIAVLDPHGGGHFSHRASRQGGLLSLRDGG